MQNSKSLSVKPTGFLTHAEKIKSSPLVLVLKSTGQSPESSIKHLSPSFSSMHRCCCIRKKFLIRETSLLLFPGSIPDKPNKQNIAVMRIHPPIQSNNCLNDRSYILCNIIKAMGANMTTHSSKLRSMQLITPVVFALIMRNRLFNLAGTFIFFSLFISNAAIERRVIRSLIPIPNLTVD